LASQVYHPHVSLYVNFLLLISLEYLRVSASERERERERERYVKCIPAIDSIAEEETKVWSMDYGEESNLKSQ